MALTESNMLPLGTEAPPFALPDTVSGDTIRFEDISAGKKATVVMFICNHCPYVIHVNPEIIRVVNDYQSKDVAFVGISSNDVANYPQDGPDKMKIHAEETGYNFPYLYDESQNVAHAYDAACTPDFYVFNEEKQLVYRGRLDGSRPGNDAALNGADLRAALDAALTGSQPLDTQYPSAGCNIKWK